MNLEKQAIEILQDFATEQKYVISDSGGKDSSVLRGIAEKSKTPIRIVHNLTTVDAPETVHYVRQQKREYDLKGIQYDIVAPPLNMWQLIEKHGTPPTRLMRYCCGDLKEYYGRGEKIVTGVRKSESRNRSENQGIVTFPKPNKKVRNTVDDINFHSTSKGGVVIRNIDNDESRRMVENCYRTSKTLINPIINWDDEFTWWYIRKNNLVINPLYEKGFCRVGCIGCPMSGKNRWTEFNMFPTYKAAYIRAFDKMLARRELKGLENRMGWKDGYSVFLWWMEDENINGQYGMEFEENGDFSQFNER